MMVTGQNAKVQAVTCDFVGGDHELTTAPCSPGGGVLVGRDPAASAGDTGVLTGRRTFRYVKAGDCSWSARRAGPRADHQPSGPHPTVTTYGAIGDTKSS